MAPVLEDSDTAEWRRVRDFYIARLDEEWDLARKAGNSDELFEGAEWKRKCEHESIEDCVYSSCCRVEGKSITIYDEGGHDEYQAQHIVTHDPRRVLRDIAAKRSIFMFWWSAYQGIIHPYQYLGSDWDTIREWATFTVLSLVAVYSGHSEYQEHWDPQRWSE